MIGIAARSCSDELALEEVIRRLTASPAVDGIAEFGSRSADQASVWSDYDLLVLVRAIPAAVFQMITTINGRIADVVLVDVDTADSVVAADTPPPPQSFAALFAQKMRTAHIIYDASDRLHKVQELVTSEAWAGKARQGLVNPDVYAAWFWLSFGLMQLERMGSADDPVYETAVDMMLSACLPGTWKTYFEYRAIPWQGEKAAVRYWQEHDAEYLAAVRKCLASSSREQKLARYRDLVELTLGPMARKLGHGETAVILQGRNEREGILAVLAYWEALLTHGTAHDEFRV